MVKNEYKFIKKWDVSNHDADWVKESRTELNKIIDEYNQWQINDFPYPDIKRLLALIEYGKQIIASQEGGESYMEELMNMEKFVNEKTKIKYF